MTTSLAFAIATWIIPLGALAYWTFNWVMAKASPKYVAKRKLRRHAKDERDQQKRRQRRAAERSRLATWATENIDDPLAKTFLSQESSRSLPSLIDNEADPVIELRLRQQANDDLERQLKDRETYTQKLLVWSLAHPETPEGRRHLEETLEKASQDLEWATTRLGIASRRMEWNEDGLEAIDAATSMAEANTNKEAAEQMIRDIQAALSPGHLTESEE